MFKFEKKILALISAGAMLISSVTIAGSELKAMGVT